MNGYIFLAPEECNGFLEPKPFLNMGGIQDIAKKRLVRFISMPSPSLIADSYGTKSISDSEQIFEKNRNSFLKLKETLLQNKEYANKFVAIIEGEIVDSDYDRSKLAERVYARYGYVHLFMGKVVKQKRFRELPSPERVKV
jgi:hypothetical protein